MRLFKYKIENNAKKSNICITLRRNFLIFNFLKLKKNNNVGKFLNINFDNNPKK